MLSMNPHSRMRLVSRLSVVGAWATLASGIILIVLFYSLNNVSAGPNSGPGLGVLIFVELIIAMVTFFFFLVLYAIGALLNYMSAPKVAHQEDMKPPGMKKLPEEDDMQLEITPLQQG